MATPINQSSIRQYLLGQLDEERQQDLEKRLLSEELVFDEVLATEDDLIDEYLADQLSPSERADFERHFLATPQQQQKLSFGRAFNRYLRAQSALQTAPARVQPQAAPWWRQLLPSSPLRAAVWALVVLAIGIGAWRLFFYTSDTDRGLLALNAAYRQQRPIETRVSALSYAPFPQTRGAEPDRLNATERDRAERILLDAAHDNPGPVTFHALGQLYLVEKQFDKAIEEFDQAILLAPRNSQLLSDRGAALMEKGKLERHGPEPGQGLADFARGLADLNQALELDQTLRAALFNRGLCYQYMMLPRQAKDDWREYLKLDSTSPWADEARHNLNLLEAQTTNASPHQEKLLEDFLTVYQARADDAAWQIIRDNREAVTAQCIWQQLVTGFLSESRTGRQPEARKLLMALQYAGSLEAKQTADVFVASIADFYTRTPPKNLSALGQANEFMRSGLDFYRSAKFNEALDLFDRAKGIFSSLGDQPEYIFAQRWVGSAKYQLVRIDESLSDLAATAQAAAAHNYQWVLAQCLDMLGTVAVSKNEHSRGLDYWRRSLDTSIAIRDEYQVQKELTNFAMIYRVLGNHDQSLTYLQRGLGSAAIFWPGQRQMWRDYETATLVLYSANLPAGAAAYAAEGLQLAVAEKDESLIYISWVHLGLARSRLGKYDEALQNIQQGSEIGQAKSTQTFGRSMLAYSALQRANVQRASGNITAALHSYDQAIELYQGLSFEIYLYATHKGRFFCYVATQDDAAADRELGVVLTLFEKYRTKILEERNRDIFFDAEQETYDLAIDFAHTRLQDDRKAFAYSEASRGRSLLDLLKNHTTLSAAKTDADILFAAASQPLALADIQSHLPENVQVLQYAVLNDKLLLWVISRQTFMAAASGINLANLSQRVARFRELIANGQSSEAEIKTQAVALHGALIGPVKQYLDPNKQLCIVPDKALNYLPFAALMDPESGAYLVSEYSLLLSPSANVMLASSEIAQRKNTGPAERVLAVGIPTLNRRAYNELPDLPAAANEAKEVAALYASGSALIGPQAEKGRVLNAMKVADVIHFASHYLANEQNPMLSELPLPGPAAGGYDAAAASSNLRVQDIYGLKLNARLVVLSACRTAGEGYYQGEGLIGISRTFIAVGVPLVVASEWPVDSAATAKLMINFHRYRKREHATTVSALRRAQLDMLNDPEPTYHRPYYWAAFVPMGGYAQF